MDEIKPMYDVGSRVFISNPLDAFADVEDTTVYTIEDVKFVPKYFTHFYRINNGKWINESWLESDIFGPQYLDEEAEDLKKPKYNERQALELEQDYELASLFKAMSERDEEEKERSKQRLSEIRAELEALE